VRENGPFSTGLKLVRSFGPRTIDTLGDEAAQSDPGTGPLSPIENWPNVAEDKERAAKGRLPFNWSHWTRERASPPQQKHSPSDTSGPTGTQKHNLCTKCPSPPRRRGSDCSRTSKTIDAWRLGNRGLFFFVVLFEAAYFSYFKTTYSPSPLGSFPLSSSIIITLAALLGPTSDNKF
jgi:hypothetical protein